MPSTLVRETPLPPPGETVHKVIVFEDVVLAFEDNPVLDGVSFEVARGETKVLFGVAGSGKTTILKLVLGLVRPDRGRIWVLGHEVTAMSEDDLFDLRRKIGMVFQESALFDSLTVEENVAYRLREEGDLSEEEIHQRVEEALRFVELGHTLAMFPSELSGGMRRRVAIARAIVHRPEILLYDSPTAGLDPITSTTIIELIVKQRDIYESSALMVTHRLPDGFTLASHYFDSEANQMKPVAGTGRRETRTTFLILRDGKKIFDGTAREIVASRDEYIREYLS
ncbi:MAG TPA: ATP-binding cassette domain-containing protein [Terriglobales bacterium]|nr:ATP-binding cassette domain-containing protein [Terriglobales bacterium]